MSKAIGNGGGNSDLVLVAALIIGAMMFTRMRTAGATQTVTRPVYVPASTSGANGNGVAQVAAGLVGGLANWFSGINSSYGNGMDTYNGTATQQNSFGLYGNIGGTAEDPWYG